MCVRSNTAAPTEQSYALRFRRGTGRHALSCWLALPKHIAPGAQPLVAVHGIRRGARQQATLFAKRAIALGRPVIAPLFDAQTWHGYQKAFLTGRADIALLDLILALRLEGIIQSEKVDLFGFSGGAQFVHRFAMLRPDRVAQLSIASPGWYTFPDYAPYPYGMWPRPNHVDTWSHRLITNVDRFLALPMRISVGANDCRRDKNTRRGPSIDAQQGVHRLERATRWSDAVRRAAHELNIVPDVSLHVLPGCGHDFETCVIKGGLDQIVVPDTPTLPAGICRGTCSARQRTACHSASARTSFNFREVSG